MPTQLRPAVVDYIRHKIGDRCLVETVDTHGVADLDNGRTAFLAEQPLCISTPCGMAVCGRTALHLLPYLRLRHVPRDELCASCLIAMEYLWRQLPRAEQNRWAKVRRVRT
jgi:hypothetical protein